MNYDGSQQYGFNLGLAAASAGNQHATTQNVAGSIYPYTFHGTADLQQQHLSAKLASVPIQAAAHLPAVATMAGKNIIYTPQQHALQHQHQLPHPQQLQHQQQLQTHQLQQQQQVGTLSMVHGPAIAGRQSVFPMTAAGLSMGQDQLCSPQAMVDVYGNLSPNMMTQKVAATAAGSYKNFTNWMSLPQAINSNVSNISTSSNNPQPSLPSIGHLWSHFQQQKQQTAMTTFIQAASQQPSALVQQQQQHSMNNFQSVHLLQGSPASIQVSPGALHLSPGNMQVSPGGQTFQNTLSPNPVAVTANVNFSSIRHVPASAVRSQMMMSPRGQLIMAQAIPAAATTLSISSEMKKMQPVGKTTVGSLVGVSVPNTPASQSGFMASNPFRGTADIIVSTVNAAGLATACSTAESTVTNTTPAALTPTTVTVTTSTCSLTSTKATTVHTTFPLTTTISVLPHMTSLSCEHKQQTSPHGSQTSDLDAKEESGRGSMSPSTPSTAASTSTHDSMSGECSKLESNTVKVPYSWRRVVENGTVLYFSPSNICLSSCEEVRTYLSQNNTCKCGLECPLIVERIFNFDPTVESRMWSMEDVNCSGDLTKLCNHKRKVLALAAFQSSTAVQDTHSKADGPPVKCRKREKGKLSDALLVSPLVVDSKLKTSITNAVNKHAAAASAHTVNNSSMPSGSATSISLSLCELKQEPGKGIMTQGVAMPLTPTPTPNSTVDNASSQYPSPSPVTHSPASMRSTPGGSIGAGDVSEGQGIQFAGAAKVDFGRNHGFSGGIRMGMAGLNHNHMDPRHFAPGSVQCNVLSQEDLKQSYFMQQQVQQHQPQQLHPGPHNQGAGLSFMAQAHPSFGVQGPRHIGHIGVQPQFTVGFPHNPHQHPQTQQAQAYPQHGYTNAMVYPMNVQQPGHLGHQHHPSQSLLHHHSQQQQPPTHPLYQNMRMNSQNVWPPQHPQTPHHHGIAPPPGFPPELQGGVMYTGLFPQPEPMWLETGKPKSKRPRSKKDKQKLNSIVDRTSPCESGLKVKTATGGISANPVASKCVIPSTLSLSPSSTTSAVFSPGVSSLPCSVSFLENPAVFVAQQAAIINNSLASCNIDLNSPTNQPSIYPKTSPDGISAVIPVIKMEQDCGESSPIARLHLSEVECKKEPVIEQSTLHLEQDKHSPPTHHFAESSAAKVVCACAVSNTNHNNNKLIIGKTGCDHTSPKLWNCVASSEVQCGRCTVASQPLLLAKKKASPKIKNRAKSVSAVSKANNVNPCLPECISPSSFTQHGSLPLPVPNNTADLCSQGAIVGASSLQIPDLSQVLVGGGNNNLNLFALQQALAQYSVPSCSANSVHGMGGNGNGAPDFPASSLLTAAARGQLTQQAPLGSFIFPAFLQASGIAGQDVSLIATPAMQQQLQQQQQQVDTSSMSVNTSTELNKTAAMMAAGLVGLNPAGISSMNPAGTLPIQLVSNGNMITTGMLPTAQFQHGTVLTAGVPAIQGLPLNVLLPISQQLVGLGPEPMQGISVDLSGNVIANVSLGANVNKTVTVSPKVFTSVVDSVAAVSPGGQVLAAGQGSFSPQMPSTTMKATGSTIHHLPQHSISNNTGHNISVAQNVGHSINQSFQQNLNQVQNLTATVGQSLGQGLAQNINQTLTQQLGPSIASAATDGVSVGAGEAVMLNNLLPSILAFNAPMPPISIPMVTNVTNSLTQVIPALGTTQALMAQQQQQATAQFLNALAFPAVAAAFTNPLLIANPLSASNTHHSTKIAADLNSEDKIHETHVMQRGAEYAQADEEKSEMADGQREENAEEAEPGLVKDFEQTATQPVSMAGDAQPQHQVFVLPGSGVPLMQVLNNPSAVNTSPADKLCNTTQIFLPAAPQSASLSDLAQLGPVALTPLGIQQMWNSLNSLQLQQLQTLQLQQLVWQQLQGCIPHQVTTIDPSVAQLLPAQFFPHIQQMAGGQEQDEVATSYAQDEEGMEYMQTDVDREKDGFESVGPCTSAELSPASVSKEKNKSITDIDAGQEEAVDSNVECSTDDQCSADSDSKFSLGSAQVLDYVSSPMLVSVPRVQTVLPLVSVDVQAKTSTSASAHGKQNHMDSLKISQATKAVVQSNLEPSGLPLHVTMNGECSTEIRGGVTGGRRMVKSGLEDRCSGLTPAPAKALTIGQGAVALAGVVMSSSQGSIRL